MKNFSLILVLVCSGFLFGCSNDSDQVQTQKIVIQNGQKITFKSNEVEKKSISLNSDQVEFIKTYFDLDRVKTIMEAISPSSGEERNDKNVEAVSNQYAGLRKKVKKTLKEPFYVVHAGIGHELEFTVNQPTIVVTSDGNKNSYKIIPTEDVKDQVFFLVNGGLKNIHEGAPVISFAEFRDEVF